MASTYLTRTPSSSGNRKTWTLSMWVKRSNDNYSQLSGTGTGSTYLIIGFGDTQPRILQSANAGEAVEVQINNKCRDVNGYYHLVFRVDTTQATASNRIRIYINGEEGTYSETDYPSQNLDMYYNYNILHGIGARSDGDSGFDGIMSHVHFADGQSLAPTVFGETDSTTGEWKIKTNPTFTLGTNGFTILKDGNTITDQSSNSNNWTVAAGGTLTKTEDNPSNVFATWNNLSDVSDNFTFANGNTYSSITSGGHNYVVSTLGASSGKYYCEMKANTTGGNNKWMFGISTHPSLNSNGDYLGKDAEGWGYKGMDGQLYNNDNNPSWGGTYGAGDIIGVAMDLDNNRLFFSKNGVWQNSANPTTSTGAISITAPSSTSTGFYHFAWGDIDHVGVHTMYANFGNGYFGTTAVSSAGTNASGNGIFEYDVPTGYTALSTKGLNL